MSRLKIAVVLAGQPRFIDQAFSSIKNNLLQDYDVDAFIHFWKGKTLFDQRHPNAKDMNVTENDSLYEKSLELYNPKAWLFEPQPDTRFNFYYCETFGDPQQFSTMQNIMSAGNTFPLADLTAWSDNREKLFPTYGNYPHHNTSQWISWQRANNLKMAYECQNGFKYDWVVRLRSDYVLKTLIKFESYDKSALHVKDDCHHHISRGDWYSLNDHFGFGSSKIMDYYANFIDYLPKYYQIDRIKFNTEVLLGWHINQAKIEVQKHAIGCTVIR